MNVNEILDKVKNEYQKMIIKHKHSDFHIKFNYDYELDFYQFYFTIPESGPIEKIYKDIIKNIFPDFEHYLFDCQCDELIYDYLLEEADNPNEYILKFIDNDWDFILE